MEVEISRQTKNRKQQQQQNTTILKYISLYVQCTMCSFAHAKASLTVLAFVTAYAISRTYMARPKQERSK